MAPTEILAEQHFRKLIGWLEPLLTPRGQRVAWLTGSQKKKERGEMLRLVASGEADPAAARDMAYEDAREYLTRFVGVGDKVADCVLLFSLDFLEAVPLDTWLRTTIADYYPDCDRGNYDETSRAIRESLGGEYAGYVQTYIFHFLRSGGDSR
jgi:3-methyladenine DNA glycosylase/8-oxoguanine DNA glycosylase